MLRMSWNTFLERWQVFAGAIVTVCLGVALVQSSLLNLVTADSATVPAGLPADQALALREGYEGASALLGITLMLSTFIAVFIVSSTFAFAVAQRRRDLALLRLTGASRRQVRRLLLGEALLLGAIGTALGVLVGLPAMWLQARLLDALGFVPPGFTGQWRPWVVAVSLGTGVGIAVLGVLAASRRASRVRPLEALRETGRAGRVMTASRWVLGGLFLAGGCAAVVLVPALGGEEALGLSVLNSMLLVVAFAALAPLAVPLVSRLLGVFARGQLGQLAYANLRSGVRRSASTAAPVMVLVAFVASLAGTLGTIGEASREEMTRTLRGDLVVASDRPVGAELAEVDGVRTVSEELPVSFDVEVDEGDGATSYEPSDGLAVEPGAYADTHRVDVSAGSLTDLRGPAIAVSPSAFPEQRLQVGDLLPVRLAGEPAELRVVALLPQTVTGPFVLLPHGVAPESTSERRYVVGLADGADVAAVRDRMAGVGAVLTTEQWIRQYADQEQRMSLNIMVALLGMAALYTIIAMVNAVVIATSDRRGEFAAARVTGLTRGQVVRAALWEAFAVVAVGLLLGGLAAATTVFGAALAIEDMLGISAMSVSPALLVGLALGAVTVVGVSTVLTTWSATRTPAIRLVAARE